MNYFKKRSLILFATFSIATASAQALTEAQQITRLAEQGDEAAQVMLGSMYISGQGVSQDYQQAAKWLKLAAEQGNIEAAYNLGVFYDTVEQNYPEAFKWYKIVAEQGESNAQTNIGVMYELGQGVTQSNQEAFNWFTKAAKQGNVTAQANLGKMYYLGKGVDKNLTKSYMWLSIAKLNDGMSVPTSNLLAIEKELSEADSKKVKTMVDNCKNSNYQDCD